MEMFNVCQFFTDGSHEYVRQHATAEEAVKVFISYCHSVGAKIGTTVRIIIITDDDDSINMEWVHGQGVVYPPIKEKQYD